MTSRNFFKLIVLLATLVYLPHSLAQDTVDKFQIRTLTGPRPALHAVFSPDGQTFRTMAYIRDSEKEPGAAFIEIILWDVATGRQVSTFQSPMKLHFSSRIIAASLDGETLAYTVFSDIIEIIVWDVATGREKTRRSMRWYHSVALSPDGETLAYDETGDSIIVWDVAAGTTTTLPTAGHDIQFSPDGETLAVTNYGGITLWDIATGTETATLPTRSVGMIQFSPDGETLAYKAGDSIIVWDVAAGTTTTAILPAEIIGPSGFGGFGLSKGMIQFSPDGETLAVANYGGITLWDIATGTTTATLPTATLSALPEGIIQFSPDGETLAIVSRLGTIHLWELPATQVRITPFPAESPSIGAELTINVAIVAGQNVGGYQVTVEFDETALYYVKSANGDYLPPGAFAAPPDVSYGKVTLAATSLAGTANGDGTLVTLTFEVVDIKASKLILSEGILTDSSGERLPHRVFSGLVTDPQIGPEDVNSDGIVNILDLVKVASRFNQRFDIEKEDINGDGIVNIVDLVKVAGAIGGRAAAPSLHPETLAMFTAADVQKWLSAAQQRNLPDAASQRGVLFLENLLAALRPKETALLPNYPNPFNPETWIPYQLVAASDVRVLIYDVRGVVVRELVLGHTPAGVYTDKSRAAYWDGKNAQGEPVASGVYFYTLSTESTRDSVTAGNFTATRKMLIRK